MLFTFPKLGTKSTEIVFLICNFHQGVIMLSAIFIEGSIVFNLVLSKKFSSLISVYFREKVLIGLKCV